MQAYNKFTVALVGQAATWFMMLTGLEVSPELIQAVGGLVTALLVLRVPNRP